jgi:ABC-type dipeptide/oligopeptide/nickel transport system permease subunit
MALAPTEFAAQTESAASIPFEPVSKTRSFGARLLRHPLAIVGLAIIALLLILALFAPLIAPQNPRAILEAGISKVGEPHPPGNGFPLGADPLGRDVLSRLIWGARISLRVAFYAMLTSVTIGTVIGLLGGYFGGWVDTLLTRLTETVMSLPTVLLAISLFVLLPGDTPDQRLFKLLLAIGLVTWTGIARAVRGQVLSLKEREFIEAARALGCSHARILLVHLLPNVLPTVLVLATLATAHNILLEAGLSYLGQGVEQSEPSWGGMIRDGEPFMLSSPWILFSAGAAVVLAVTGFNLLGQALQETLEPRR